MSRWQSVVALAFSDGVPRRAFYVALLVGGLLNLINQGDAIFGGGSINWLKLGLTFVVPYCVSTHGAIAAKLSTATS